MISHAHSTAPSPIPASPPYQVYFNGFWEGFMENTDGNGVHVFIKIIEKTCLYPYEITNDPANADVLVESIFSPSMVHIKRWKYKIHFSGESKLYPFRDYDVVLFSTMTHSIPNIVDFPLFVSYIHSNTWMPRLLNRPPVTKPPPKFCCFIVSNPRCQTRNRMFELLHKYKPVHSYGNYANNMGRRISHNYWSVEFLKKIAEYKFVLYFENSKFGTYMTEKIVNPYLAHIVPIYWSSHHVKHIFNMKSMIFLEDESDEAFQRVVEKVIELDQDDEKYIEMANQPVFSREGVKYWENHYTIETIAHNIDSVLLRPQNIYTLEHL